jgi:hypothetical protein
MAVLVTSDANYPTLLSAIPLDKFTVHALSYTEVDRGTISQTLVMATRTFGTDADAFNRWEGTTSDVMDVGSYDGSTADIVPFGSRPAINQWYAWFMQRNGGTLRFGWRLQASGSWTVQSATMQAGSTGTAHLMLGYNGFGGSNEYSQTRFSSVKVWSVAAAEGLDDAALLLEGAQQAAVRTADLITANMKVSAVSVADALSAYAGASGGIAFTENGTLSLADDPTYAGGAASPRNLLLTGVG